MKSLITIAFTFDNFTKNLKMVFPSFNFSFLAILYLYSYT